MNVLSKIKRNDEIYPFNLDFDIYSFRCLIIAQLCVDIVKDIYCIDRPFFNRYIKKNPTFKYILNRLEEKDLNKRGISNWIKNDQGTLVLILFLLEEFYFAWTSKYERIGLENTHLLLDVFIRYIKKHYNHDICDFIDYIPMMVREKYNTSYVFQMTYIALLTLPATSNFIKVAVTLIEKLVFHYEIDRNITTFGEYNPIYLKKCFAHTVVKHGVEYVSPCNIDMTRFEFDISAFIVQLSYIWIVFNPFALKPYNKLVLSMCEKIDMQLKSSVDLDKEYIHGLKRKYAILNIEGTEESLKIIDKVYKC